MEDPRGVLRMVVMNGGTQTFLKSQETEVLLAALHQLLCQGYLERVSETPQTITFRVAECQYSQPTAASGSSSLATQSSIA